MTHHLEDDRTEGPECPDCGGELVDIPDGRTLDWVCMECDCVRGDDEVSA